MHHSFLKLVVVVIDVEATSFRGDHLCILILSFNRLIVSSVSGENSPGSGPVQKEFLVSSGQFMSGKLDYFLGYLGETWGVATVTCTSHESDVRNSISGFSGRWDKNWWIAQRPIWRGKTFHLLAADNSWSTTHLFLVNHVQVAVNVWLAVLWNIRMHKPSWSPSVSVLTWVFRWTWCRDHVGGIDPRWLVMESSSRLEKDGMGVLIQETKAYRSSWIRKWQRALIKRQEYQRPAVWESDS